jgi:hypothetical protein
MYVTHSVMGESPIVHLILNKQEKLLMQQRKRKLLKML